MQEYNEQTPILQAKIKYASELETNTIKNNLEKERHTTINNIYDRKKEVTQNINNKLTTHKEKIILIRNLIAQDYVNNNKIEYDHKYGDYIIYTKYVNKVINCINKGGVIIDKNNNWSIRLWNYKNNYLFNDIFNKKNIKYELIKFYDFKISCEEIKKTILNNFFSTFSLLVSSCFPLVGFLLLSCFIASLFVYDGKLTAIVIFFALSFVVICVIPLFCSVVISLLKLLKSWLDMCNLRSQYYEYKEKREKYYNVIGKNDMELLIDLNDQYNKLIKASS